MKPIDNIFTEKYRPKKVSEMVGEFREKIEKYLTNPESIPNFLFYSKTPGTGKTSLSKAIINELDCDSITINSSDDRKIETIRSKVKEFALTQSSKPGKKRAVFLDEFDGMLKASQEALRNVMETYAGNCFFILTCNNLSKVIAPIQSRCVTIPFAYPKREEVKEYLKMICEKEVLSYNDEGLNKLIELNYPSIRNCVLALQDLNTEGLSVSPENVKPVNEVFIELWNLLKKKEWKEIKNEVMRSTIDARELNSYFWERGLEEDNLKLIQVCCRNERDIAMSAEPKIIFVTSLVEMVK